MWSQVFIDTLTSALILKEEPSLVAHTQWQKNTSGGLQHQTHERHLGCMCIRPEMFDIQSLVRYATSLVPWSQPVTQTITQNCQNC